MKKLLLSSTAVMVLTSACAVGPDFLSPGAPDTKGYTATPMPEKTASAESKSGAAQHFVHDKDIPAQWWTLFGSEPLNKLMEQALAANPDLQAAKAALRQAQEAMLSERGQLLPSVDASFAPTRQKTNPASFGQSGPSNIYNLYNASVSVSYAVDIFGATIRELESLRAQVDVQKFELEATYLTLTSNIVNAAIAEASLREQIKETRNILSIQREQAKLLDRQFQLGAIPKTSLLEQQALVAQTETTLPPLEKQLVQKRHQLAVLAGKLPSDDIGPAFDLDMLHLPEELPVSLPSQLVQQRPDIRAAESLMHAASAEVGVATAAMLPRVSLSASYGVSSSQIHSLFTPDSLAWNLGGNLLQPLFRGGELLHAKRGKEAAFDRAKAQYQGVVLQAFQNVADVLRALQYDADGLASQVKAERAAADSFSLSRTQYEAGAITYSQMLDTQRTWQQSRIGLVQAQANRLADSVALFQALGGGWWNRDARQPAAPVVAATATDDVAPANVPQATPEKTTPVAGAPAETASATRPSPLDITATPPAPEASRSPTQTLSPASASSPASPTLNQEKKP